MPSSPWYKGPNYYTTITLITLLTHTRLSHSCPTQLLPLLSTLHSSRRYTGHNYTTLTRTYTTLAPTHLIHFLPARAQLFRLVSTLPSSRRYKGPNCKNLNVPLRLRDEPGPILLDSYDKRIVLFLLSVVELSCAARQVYKDTIARNSSNFKNSEKCEALKRAVSGYKRMTFLVK
jgi:hypothetical protein